MTDSWTGVTRYRSDVFYKTSTLKATHPPEPKIKEIIPSQPTKDKYCCATIVTDQGYFFKIVPTRNCKK